MPSSKERNISFPITKLLNNTTINVSIIKHIGKQIGTTENHKKFKSVVFFSSEKTLKHDSLI